MSCNETAVEPLRSPDHHEAFISHYAPPSSPAPPESRYNTPLCSLLIGGEGVRWSAASVYLRIQMKFKQKSRLCWFFLSEKREIKRRCVTEGCPQMKKYKASVFSYAGGAVIESDSCNRRLPKPPTVSSQGKNECTGQWRWHSVTGKKTISKTNREVQWDVQCIIIISARLNSPAIMSFL